MYIYIYDVYCISRRQYQRFLDILFRDVSVAQLVASMSGVVLGGVVMVSLLAKYLQHLSTWLIHYIYLSLYLGSNILNTNCILLFQRERQFIMSKTKWGHIIKVLCHIQQCSHYRLLLLLLLLLLFSFIIIYFYIYLLM